MTEILTPGAGILFMKVGTHAGEQLEDIIARKMKEVDEAGYAMWGYGGNTCHPLSMVQPFAEEHSIKGEPIYLCMNEMTSNHFAEPICTTDFSADGVGWHPVPKGINVRGSRFALCIKNLRPAVFELPLSRTRVAVGNQRGRLGSRYVQGRVDKACLDFTDEIPNDAEPHDVVINLVAELQPPFAVFLRIK